MKEQSRSSRIHKYMKRGCTGLFAMIVAFGGFNITQIIAMNANGLVAQADEVLNDLEELKGRNVSETANGYALNRVGGNNHAISKTSAVSFTYEADIRFLDGNCASLAFGVSKPDYQDFGSLFGLEVSRDNVGEHGDLFIKMFQDGSGALGEGIINRTKVFTDINNTESIKLKLTINEAKEIQIEINNQKVSFNLGPKGEAFKTSYVGGYLGMMTWDTGASFEHIKVTKTSDVQDGFVTNLNNLHGLNGTWTKTEDGLYSTSNGDGFAMSDTTGSNFVYEADVKVGPSGAAALVFRSSDDGKQAYVANINRQDKSVRIFKFPGGGNVGSATLPNSDKENFKIRVDAIGDALRFYVDDELLIAGNDDTYTSGKFGLLTWNGSMTYQNVNQKPVNVDDYPTLSGLEIIGDDVLMTPTFKKSIAKYNIFVPSKSETVKIKPSTTSGTNLSMSVIASNGEVIVAEKAITSGVLSESIALPVGESTIRIHATKDGIKNTTLIVANRKSDPEMLNKEDQRPQFHFSPEINFMNDPNGLVFDPSDGKWHMFFQYSPQVGHMGSQTWGHAVSSDLVSWEEMPIAIPMDQLGAIFSGSAVVDENNTSGFFSNNVAGESKLVAMFTHAGATQQQSIAYSKDHGVTWVKYDGNPVIGNGSNQYGWDFRDPKVFRFDNKWLCVVAGGRGRIFSSDDLINWKHEEDMTYADGSELHSECPDLYPLKVDGTGETKWVYNGSANFYVIGDLVKTPSGGYHFKAETGQVASPMGKTYMYATQSFYNDGSGEGRRILVSWLQDYSAPGIFPNKRWNGIQSVATETKLKTVNGELMITHNPVSEVDTLRDTMLYQTKNKKVDSKDANILQGVTGQTYDVEATFTLGSASEFGFNLRTGTGEKTVFKYNKNTQKMILDKSSSGPGYNGIIDWDLQPTADNKVKLRILVDNSVVEAYGNDGEASISDLNFPNAESIGMEFFAIGGDVTIDDMKIYDMKSMYTGKSSSDGKEATVLSLATPTQVEIGDIFTVNANIFPSTATDKSVNWTFDAGLTKIDEGLGYITFRADAKGSFKISATTKKGNLTKEATVKVIVPKFDSNLINWKAVSGKWVIGEDGLQGNNASGGDSFYLSDTYLPKDAPFTYEGDIRLETGQAVGLVFGVKDLNNPASHWYCMNIDKKDNITKVFKNTGGQNWSVEKALTNEQKDKNDFKFKVVYDGNGTIEFYLDGILAGTRSNSGFDGGYFGVLTYHSDATFNNVNLTTNSPIISIETVFENIQVQLDSGVTIEDILASLPAQVVVKQADGVKRLTDIDWDASGVNLSLAGEYQILGTISDYGEKTVVNVSVKDTPVLLSTDPEFISLEVATNATPEEIFEQLKKIEIIGHHSDGEAYTMRVHDWDYSTIDFKTTGSYESIAYISKVDTKVRSTRANNQDTIKVRINVVASSTNVPDSSKSTIAGSTNPNTGDTTSQISLIAILLVSLTGIVALRKRIKD